MFGIQVVLVVFVGWFATYVVKRRPYDLSKTAIRKIFQVSSNGGMAIFLILMTFNDCNLIYVALVLQIISFLSMFTAGGETMIPYDLSNKYPATIMAIANCVANLSGLTTTEISRQVLRGQPSSFDRWNLLIYLVAGANIIGCIAFVSLIKAEPLDLSSKKKKKIDTKSIDADNKLKLSNETGLSNHTISQKPINGINSDNNIKKEPVMSNEQTTKEGNYNEIKNAEIETNSVTETPVTNEKEVK